MLGGARRDAVRRGPSAVCRRVREPFSGRVASPFPASGRWGSKSLTKHYRLKELGSFMPVDDRVLRGLALTRTLDNAQIRALAAIADLRSVAPGNAVTERGVRAHTVFIVLSGALHGEIAAPDGRTLLLDRLGPGDLFGEIAALDGGGRVRSVRSVGPARLAVMEAAAFDRWLRATPEAMRLLLALFADRARGMGERLFETAFFGVGTRLRRLLVQDLIAAGALRDGGALDPAPSEETLARLVGADPAAVRQALSELQEAGVVSVEPGRIVALDAAALERPGEAR